MSISLRRRLALAGVSVALGVTVLSAPAGASNIGNEGCTPGYWKNHTENWEEYSPDQTVGSVFALPPSLAMYADVTLEEALAFRGGPGAEGGARILLRAATAAFLNAAHEGLGYPYRRYDDPGDIGPKITEALASGDRATMLSLAAWLDEANNLGCPLGNETTTPVPEN